MRVVGGAVVLDTATRLLHRTLVLLSIAGARTIQARTQVLQQLASSAALSKQTVQLYRSHFVMLQLAANSSQDSLSVLTDVYKSFMLCQELPRGPALITNDLKLA